MWLSFDIFGYFWNTFQKCLNVRDLKKCQLKKWIYKLIKNMAEILSTGIFVRT